MRFECFTLNARAFGVAAGVVAATVSAICATALFVAPAAIRALLGYLIHSDLSGLAPSISWTSAILSVSGWGFLAGVVFASAAGLYNRSVIAVAERERASAPGVASRT